MSAVYAHTAAVAIIATTTTTAVAIAVVAVAVVAVAVAVADRAPAFVDPAGRVAGLAVPAPAAAAVLAAAAPPVPARRAGQWNLRPADVAAPADVQRRLAGAAGRAEAVVVRAAPARWGRVRRLADLVAPAAPPD